MASQAFPLDRGAFDRIVESGGFISANTGGAPPVPNASAMLFTAAKVNHLGALPQGQAERYRRVLNMVATMDSLGSGNCTNIGKCAAVCPEEIGMETIAPDEP